MANIDFDSLLIFEVELNPILYDRSLPQNGITSLKNDIWSSIAINLGKSAILCKKRWKHLRNTFAACYKKNDLNDWIYNEPLRFLEPYIAQHTNNSSSETPPLVDDSDSPELEGFSLAAFELKITSPSTSPPPPPPPPPSSPTSANKRQPLKRRNDVEPDELCGILNEIHNRNAKKYKSKKMKNDEGKNKC